MASNPRCWMIWLLAPALAFGTACSKEEAEKPAAEGVKSAKVPEPTPVPVTTTPARSADTPPTPTPAPEPSPDCPKGSSGAGTMSDPCEAKGAARMMEVTWTGKYDEKGPQFRVVNKSDSTILYGKIAVYFYDKGGKQLELDEKGGKEPKSKPFHTCSGNLFAGVMKPGEKATITFSCVKKDHVPENATAIEGEMQMVGFADDTEKRSKLYWRNDDLTPEVRKKGGVKK